MVCRFARSVTLYNCGTLEINGNFSCATLTNKAEEDSTIAPSVTVGTEATMSVYTVNNESNFTNNGTVSLYCYNESDAFNNIGTLINEGGLYLQSVPFTNSGTLTNDGNIHLQETSILTNTQGSQFTNNSYVGIEGTSTDSKPTTCGIVNEAGSTFTNNDKGNIYVGVKAENSYYGGSLIFNGISAENKGYIYMFGGNQSCSTVVIKQGSKLTNSGTIETMNPGVSGRISIKNYGELTSTGFITVDKFASLTNDGQMKIGGMLNNYHIITNNGTMTVSGALSNNSVTYMTMDNSYPSSINNTGTLTIEDAADIDSELTNYSLITNSGTIENSGKIYNCVAKTDETTEDGMPVYHCGELINKETGIIKNSGTIENGSNGNVLAVFTNNGQFINTYHFLNYGQFTSASEKTADGYPYSTVNNGRIYNFETGIIDITAGTMGSTPNSSYDPDLYTHYVDSITNCGTMTISAGATFTNEAGCTLSNLGILTVNGTLTNNGSFINNCYNTTDENGKPVDRYSEVTISGGSAKMENTSGSSFTNNQNCSVSVGSGSGSGESLLIFGNHATNSGTITIESNSQMQFTGSYTLSNSEGWIKNSGIIIMTTQTAEATAKISGGYLDSEKANISNVDTSTTEPYPS